MMVRTQISLTDDQIEALQRKSAARGVSMAALIRDAVDDSFAKDERRAVRLRALGVAGTFRDREGKTDVSQRHDDYLAEALEDWR